MNARKIIRFSLDNLLIFSHLTFFNKNILLFAQKIFLYQKKQSLLQCEIIIINDSNSSHFGRSPSYVNG